MLPAHPLIRILLDKYILVQIIDYLSCQLHIFIGVVKFLYIQFEYFIFVFQQLIIDIFATPHVGLVQ